MESNSLVQHDHLSVITNLRPNVKARYIGSGFLNYVYQVEDEVFRFPKDQFGRDTLLYEEAILRKLKGRTALHISEVHEIAQDGEYGVYSYVPGTICTLEQIHAFSDADKILLGQDIARFMKEVDNALTVSETAPLLKKFVPWRQDEPTYYTSKLHSNTDSIYHEQYAAYYQKYTERLNTLESPRTFISHGDIWVDNMLFDDEHRLQGIIDFGDTGPVTIYNELRQIYRMGEDVVQYIVHELNGYFGNIDIEAIRLLAVTHELSVLKRSKSSSLESITRAELAKNLLKQWIGPKWNLP